MNALVTRALRTLALTAATVLILQAANAELPHPIGKATIPFDFELNGQHFQAGQYSFGAAGRFMHVSDGTHAGIAIFRGERDTADNRPSNMVFHCFHGQCFLREIWRNDEATHILFDQSKAETHLRKEMLAQKQSATGDDSVVAFQ